MYIFITLIILLCFFLQINIDSVKYFDEAGISTVESNKSETVKMVSLSMASKCLEIGTISAFINKHNESVLLPSGMLLLIMLTNYDMHMYCVTLILYRSSKNKIGLHVWRTTDKTSLKKG